MLNECIVRAHRVLSHKSIQLWPSDAVHEIQTPKGPSQATESRSRSMGTWKLAKTSYMTLHVIIIPT